MGWPRQHEQCGGANGIVAVARIGNMMMCSFSDMKILKQSLYGTVAVRSMFHGVIVLCYPSYSLP
jgi:hypothetical protein